jgi:hypothetical protein
MDQMKHRRTRRERMAIEHYASPATASHGIQPIGWIGFFEPGPKKQKSLQLMLVGGTA